MTHGFNLLHNGGLYVSDDCSYVGDEQIRQPAHRNPGHVCLPNARGTTGEQQLDHNGSKLYHCKLFVNGSLVYMCMYMCMYMCVYMRVHMCVYICVVILDVCS